MTKREWKNEALRYVLMAKKMKESEYRRDQEYANYLQEFFFGEDEINLNCTSKKWVERMENRQLPLSYAHYYCG